MNKFQQNVQGNTSAMCHSNCSSHANIQQQFCANQRGRDFYLCKEDVRRDMDACMSSCN